MRSLRALMSSMDSNSNVNANNKRSANDVNEHQDHANTKRTKSTKVDLRFLLASRDAGAIIGRQGKNIQMLRSKYKTVIQVPDQQGPERILTIAGDLDSSLDCLTDALATMAENQKLRQDANEIRTLVHTSQAGAIIGKGGERVKELRSRYGLEVKVFPDTCPNSTDRVILCRGEQKAILDCLRDIFTQIEKLPPRGAVQLYDPACYIEHQIQNYGGFAADESSVYGDRRHRNQGGPPPSLAPPPPPPPPAPVPPTSGGYNSNHRRPYENWEMNNTMRGGGGGGDRGGGHMYNNHYNSPPPSNHGFYLPPPPSSMMGNPSPGGGNVNNPPGPMRPLIDSYHSNSSVETQQVTIQHEYAGAIIGPRGTRISHIRQQSGASIKIDDPLPGTNSRIITIIGTPSQISQAQHLLQTAVRQSGLYPG